MQRSMIYEHNVDIPVRDGSVLRANVYRPVAAGTFPVIMSLGPYGKDRHLADRAPQLARELGGGPFINWETPDPQSWVPKDYVVVRVDSRGSGESPGFLAPFSRQIAEDYYDAIEWAAVQPWSTGKVGTLGVSYYGATQWAVAALKPPHLAAMVPWEAFSDAYRDLYRHGGILNNKFIEWWWPQTLLNVQHGLGKLPEAELKTNRMAVLDELRARPLSEPFYTEWVPDLSTIEVPFVSVGNWGNVGLHLRGNVEAFTRAASKHKWLRLVVGDHVLPAYAPEALAMQVKFFDHFLKGHANGWPDEPRVQAALRSSDGLTQRTAKSWPIEGTRWTTMHLGANDGTLGPTKPMQAGAVQYAAEGPAVSFSTGPFEARVEVIGPVSLRVWASSSLSDMDVFVRLRKIDAHGNDLVGVGPAGGHMALALGWLRASHRKLDAARSLPHRPFHAHDESQPLTPGEPVPLDIEIWPTSIVFEPGSRLVLEIAGHDYEKGGPLGHGAADPDAKPTPFIHFLHDDTADRPAARFAGTHTVYTGGAHDSYLLLPVVPTGD
jgi:uncharacterized protein